MVDAGFGADPGRASEREQATQSLSSISSLWVLAALAPVALTVIVIGAGFTLAGGADPGFPPKFPTLAYGVANIVVIAVLYTKMSGANWRASALFRNPRRREVAGGIVAAVVGVAIGWPLTALVAEAAAIPRYTVPALSTPAGIAAVLFGAVLVAPIAEEILFRGLFLGIALNRGYGALAAGSSSLVVFAAIHVFTAGLAGVVNALILGALLTWLRLQYNNLVGAWLMHLLNNFLEFLVALSAVPSLYAI